MKAKVWRGETKLGEKYDVLELSRLPDDLQAEGRGYRTAMIGRSPDDDDLMEKYLGGEELTVAEIKSVCAS